MPSIKPSVCPKLGGMCDNMECAVYDSCHNVILVINGSVSVYYGSGSQNKHDLKIKKKLKRCAE